MRKFLLVFLLLFFVGCGSAPAVQGGGDTIVSIGPAVTEILAELGVGGRIVAKDSFSVGIYGVAEDVPLIDMMAVDVETLIMLQPSVVFATDMIVIGGVNPLQLLEDNGTEVIFVPVSDSIEQIAEDIRLIANRLDMSLSGARVANQMLLEVERIREIAAEIPENERRSVYFEIYSAPLITVGSGTFLNELLETIGVINIFADQEGWLVVSDEQIIDRNPDVILTNLEGPGPVADILSRPGWGGIAAVADGRVFMVDPDASGRPSQNIVVALREMAAFVYPEFF
ncbi:MAG: ABC transporter substrate-binding protein [Defluviitaleaceae bacterium]|nr:ABC transporter substrate-binding protein [Defluviitaleaceae bacterium]